MTLEPGDTTVVLPLVPKRGTLGRTVRLKSGRIAAEDEVTDKILQKLVDEPGDLQGTRLGGHKEVHESYKGQGGIAGEVSHLNGPTVFGFMAEVQRVGGSLGETWTEAKQCGIGRLHVCPGGGRHVALNPHRGEHCGVLV